MFKQLKNLFSTNHPTGRKQMPVTGLYLSGSQYTPKDYRMHCYAKEGYEANSVVFHVINDIAESLANIEMQVMSGDVQMDGHPILGLLSKPNPQQDGVSFLKNMAVDYLLYGESFIQAPSMASEPGKVTRKQPSELWPLNPERVEIVEGKFGVPQRYEVSAKNGAKKEFPVDPDGFSSIMHIKSYNPSNFWRGLSPLNAAGYAVDLHSLSMNWNNSTMKNGARPPGVFTIEGNLSDQEFARAQKQFNEQYTGDNNGRPLVLEGNAKWQEMGRTPLDMDFNNSIESAKKQIADAYNYPLPLVSTDASSFNNVRLAREKLYEDVVIPLMERFVSSFNNWLSPLYGGNVKIVINFDNIDALEDKRQRKFERMSAAVSKSLLTINEARKELGFPPRDEAIGNALMAPANFLPLGFNIGQVAQDESKSVQELTESELKELGILTKATYKGEKIDLSIPKGVQEAAARGLELRKEHGRGGTEVGLSSARRLAKGGDATPEFVRKVARYWPRHEGDNLDENGQDGKPISNGYIAWQLWGGDPGRRWSEAKRDELDRIDEES